MFNEREVKELDKWEVEYTSPNLGEFISKLNESPMSVLTKALNVVESVSRTVANIVPDGKQDDMWRDWVIGSRLLTVSLSNISNLVMNNHNADSPVACSIANWHSLWCTSHERPIPLEWKLIMEYRIGEADWINPSQLIGNHVKSFIIKTAEELKTIKDTEILNQAVGSGVRYRLKRTHYKGFYIASGEGPLDNGGVPNKGSALLSITPSLELAIIRDNSTLRIVGSEIASDRILREFNKYVLSVGRGKVETYVLRESSNNDIQLNSFIDKQDLVEELVLYINGNPQKLAFLAIGQPGTGKTQFSLCLAREVLIPKGYVVLILGVDDLLSFRPPDWMRKVAIICNDADLLLLSRSSSVNRWGAMNIGDTEVCMQLLDGTLSKELIPTRVNDMEFEESHKNSTIYIITSNIDEKDIDLAVLRQGRLDKVAVFNKVYDRPASYLEE